MWFNSSSFLPQVAIEAPSDWSRLVQDTTASRAKAGKQEFDDDTALFKLHGYTGNQVSLYLISNL